MCKTNIYIRFSTDKQDEQQQLNTVNGWLQSHGMKADRTVRDDGISGCVSYKKRNLNDLLKDFDEGDTLVVSELSRLTRGGIIELSDMIEKYFKPRRIRLIIVNVGLDIDCSNITAMTELQLAMMASFAKMERESIRQRTKSALEVRKKKLQEKGSFISKSGNVCTRLGGTGAGLEKANEASARSRRAKAKADPNNKIIWGVLSQYTDGGTRIPTTSEYERACLTLNDMDVKTSTGLAFNVSRARNAYHNLSRIY